MRKTILIALIAVSMLFAFTACEQQMPNFPSEGDNAIAKIEVVSGPTFYAGKAYDAATYTNTGVGLVDVYRVGGDVTKNVYATITVNGTAKPGQNVANVVLPGDTTTYPTYVNAISLEKIEVTSNYAEGTEVSTASDVTLSTAVGYYTDGTELNLLADSGLIAGVEKTFDKENGQILVTAKAGYYSVEAVSAAIAVTVDDTPIPVTKVVVSYNDGKSAIIGQTFNPSLVKVVATYGSGADTEEKTLTLDKDYTLDYKAHTFAAADKTAGLTVTAILVNPPVGTEEGNKKGTVTITVVDDYVADFSVAVNKNSANEDEPYTFDAGTKISTNMGTYLTFTATKMAVASEVPEGSKTIPATSITVDPAYDTIPYGATGTFTTYFTLNAGTENAVTHPFTVNITPAAN